MPDKSAQRGTVPSVPITIERSANDLLVFPAISYAVEHNELGFCRVKDFSPDNALIREAETLIKHGLLGL